MRDYEPYYTEDGSIGLYSYADKDVYHSKFGALTEAWEKFVIPSEIDKLFETKDNIKVLDICYGIGYNTKALMSFVINYNENKKKKEFFVKKILKKIKNFLKKVFLKILNIVSKYINNRFAKRLVLSLYIDTECINKTASIDCLDINEELILLSPLFKTIKTPQEIFSKFVPDILDCFDSYYTIRDLFVKLCSHFLPKNRKEINELLELRFKNMHIDTEYKVNPYVNYILLNKLSEIYAKDYPSKDIKKIVTKSSKKKFFAKSLFSYAKFNQFWGYKLSYNGILSTFLHNIYYQYLSIRNKNIKFKSAESLFKLNFLINDARKSILSLNEQYDCVFLDAFTYTKAPQLWSVEFIAELYKRMAPSGVLLTYSNSVQVRNTLLENKFYVGKIYNEKNKKFIGTIASKDKSKIKHPLSPYEIGLCNTKAGIPYHDPNLRFDKKDILELREYEFRNSSLMSSSKYIKLRGDKNEQEI